MGRLDGRTVLITGASRGIGAAVAQRAAAEGADLALTARTLDAHPTLAGSLQETAARCATHGNRVEVIAADLAEADSRSTIVPAAVAALGPVDVLVNNAAAGVYMPIADYPLHRRRLMVEVNVQAPIDLIQAVLPSMIDAGEGWIVNLSSGSKRHPVGPPYDLGGVKGVYGFYGASKAMLDRVTTALASEIAEHRVRVNTVEPRNAVMSEGADEMIGHFIDEARIESMEAMVESVLWLATCGADHTGRNDVSLDLLDATGTTVMDLDGRAPYPGGQRRWLP